MLRDELITKDWRRSLVVAMAVSVSLQAVAVVEFLTASLPSLVGARWPGTFYPLVAFGMVLSLAVPFVRNGRQAAVLVVLRVVTISIIGYPLERNVEVELALLLAVIVEIGLLFPPGRSIPSCALVLAVTLSLQGRADAWHTSLPGARWDDLVRLGVYGALTAATSISVRALVAHIKDSESHARRLDDAVAQLAQANIGFQQHANEVESEAALRERNRVTREIHDTVGYSYSTTMMMMEAAAALADRDPEGAKEVLRKAKGHMNDSLEEIRDSLRSLRAMEHKGLQGIRAIQHLVDNFQTATGVCVTTDFGNTPWSFGTRLDWFLYRFVQEGLTNSFRHGRATNIKIMLWCSDSQVVAMVHDNGIGESKVKPGIGLLGMHERVDSLGGEVTLSSRSDGFTLTARVPWNREAQT